MNANLKNVITGVTIGLAGMSAGCVNVDSSGLEPGTTPINAERSSAISDKRIADSNEKIARELHRIADSLERLSLPPRPEAENPQ